MKEENQTKEPALAGRLYKLMEQTGVNKSGLARVCGISPQAAGRWFTKGKMSKESALKISEAFAVSLSWLLSDDDSADESPFAPDIALTEKHRTLLNLFDRLPESEQDKHIESLKMMVENYDKLFNELLKARNIKEIMSAKQGK
jgi:transcriptional regulator with XRE-family HTH domain